MQPTPSSNGEPPRKINILVGTANLGNQEPDLESLSAWIPKDGKIKDVLDNVRYPLPPGTNRIPRSMKAVVGEVLRRKPTKQIEPETHPTTREKFDIIVIGMQEATFGVEDNWEGLRATMLIPSQAIKAQKAMFDLTTAKDHMGSARLRQERQASVNSQSSNGRPPLPGASHALMKSFTRLPGALGAWRSVRTNFSPIAERKPSSSMFLGARPSTAPSEVSQDNKGDMSFREINEGNEALDMSTSYRRQQTNDTKILHGLFQTHLPGYEHVVSYQRGQMRLMIFFNSNEISMEVLSIKAQNTGKGGLANKGGIVAEVLVNGTTRLAFCTAHLEAHEGASKYETRCSSMTDILRGTTSSVSQYRYDTSQASHFTFAMGDLNFRTRLPDHEPGSPEHLETSLEMAKAKDWKGLFEHDELAMAMNNNHCFAGFSTPKCFFPPTFKVERQKGYVYSAKRSPSYTDRILYTTGHRLREKLKVMAYEPIDDFASSDHKPIRGAFEVELNPHLKGRPTILKEHEKADKREYLYLFISSIHVQIDKEVFNKRVSESNSPSPLVCFVSTPAEAIKKETKKWASLKQTVETGRTENIPWPKTRRKRNTFDAFWDGGEGVHFKVRTHTKSGVPIDLSGAMIHVTVLDKKNGGKLLGSFALNLAHLIIKSRDGKNLEKTAVDPDNLSSSALYRSGVFGRSMRNMFSRRDITTTHPPTQETPEVQKRSEGVTHADYEDGNDPLKGSEPLNDGDTPKKIRAAKKRRKHRDQGNDESNTHQEKSRDHSVDTQEDGDVTSGPSAELLRRTTQTWLGRASNGFRGKMPLYNGSSQRKRTSLSSMNIYSMKVDHSLRKYGVDVGNIRLTVDAWWLSDEAAARKHKEHEQSVAM